MRSGRNRSDYSHYLSLSRGMFGTTKNALWVYQRCVSCFLLNDSIRKAFRRLPTTIEWARFRKNARRMRELRGRGIFEFLSREVLSALQLHIINEPLLPNLKTLCFWKLLGPFSPFISLFLSPGITSITLVFGIDCPEAIVASTVSSLPKLCPKLRSICLQSQTPWVPFQPPSGDLMNTVAISGMVLATNRNTLRRFLVDSPLTEEASGVVCKLPNLRHLSVIIGRETSLPSASLPNLTTLAITCDNEDDWPRLFHGATFGKLESVMFFPQSSEIGDFLGAFKRAALSSSIQNTLLTLQIRPSCSWNPIYSSLLPFRQLVDLNIKFSCGDGCSSRVDDDIVISLSRAMPKLSVLRLGYSPCGEFTTGVTAKGLIALALRCPNLRSLCVHFHVNSLSVLPTDPGISHNTEPTGSWTNCALTNLAVGEMLVPEESVLLVTLALLRIFPRIENIYHFDDGWKEVEDAIRLSKRIADCSSKKQALTTR